jgi:BolA family transcriptional regulator, general stress-responsive regulator
MTTAERIQTKLQNALAPASLEVIDDSRKHAGHAHMISRGGTATTTGETHFRIKVVARAFHGKSRVDRHRMINALLQEEFAGGVHALSIDAKTPDE